MNLEDSKQLFEQIIETKYFIKRMKFLGKDGLDIYDLEMLDKWNNDAIDYFKKNANKNELEEYYNNIDTKDINVRNDIDYRLKVLEEII